MNRRDFLQKTAAAGLLLSAMPVIDLMALSPSIMVPPNPFMQNKLKEVLRWMKITGWGDYFENTLNIKLDIEGKSLETFTAPFSSKQVNDLMQLTGLEDFGGNKLIEKGNPSLSLLYHVLASPRVKPAEVKAYPELAHLDALEDYIYAFIDENKYLNSHKNTTNVFLAVLAYEYRPAYKVPPFNPKKRTKKECAQLVYARCGMARIGEYAANYDAKNRCFTNLPKEVGAEKGIAEMPTRYGLFLVELLKKKKSDIELLNQNGRERKSWHARQFVNPIKKIAASDELSIQFGEYHLNEKLKRFAIYQYQRNPKKHKDKEATQALVLNGKYDVNKAPFTRVNATTDQGEKLKYHTEDTELVKLARVKTKAGTSEGSSVLLHSVAQRFIQEAKCQDQVITFKVPKEWSSKEKGSFKEVKNKHANRRYAAFKMPNAKGDDQANVIISHVTSYKKRQRTGFKAPKIAPLFANIKYEWVNGEKVHIDGKRFSSDEAFDHKNEKGDYDAVLFEDAICDGSICAKVKVLSSNTEKFAWLQRPILPAFSIVTAPDFFPYADSNEIRSAYFRHRAPRVDEDFLEGGTISLSRIRQGGNPFLINPFTDEPAFKENWKTDKSYDTLTAIVSATKRNHAIEKQDEFVLNFEKDYKSTSYLPDTATGVFYPGWDVTYAAKNKQAYFSTFALGSPFLEDMKLCAAGNGMWPVTSPDAARTFRGSLEPFIEGSEKAMALRRLFLPATSIPLLDQEIGIHPQSPYVKDYKEAVSYGWDGEQGPYLETCRNEVYVNYTDIERADYLDNYHRETIGFDMSKLRDLDSSELVYRMDTQRFCIKSIDKQPLGTRKVWKTGLWLVNAEKVNWENPNIKCLPDHPLFNQLEINKKHSSGLQDEGYLYVFVLTDLPKGKQRRGELDLNDEEKKRRYLSCEEIYICQVTRNALAYVKLDLKKRQKNNNKWVVKK